MAKLPKLGAPVKLRFWSLRNALGSNYGVIFDVDTEVERLCRRVRVKGGWKWQLVHYLRDKDWDVTLEQDKEILSAYVSDLEVQIIN